MQCNVSDSSYLQRTSWKLTNTHATTPIWVANGASERGIVLPTSLNCLRRWLNRSTWTRALAMFLVQVPQLHSGCLFLSKKQEFGYMLVEGESVEIWYKAGSYIRSYCNQAFEGVSMLLWGVCVPLSSKVSGCLYRKLCTVHTASYTLDGFEDSW